jgi:hypothetical protein
MHDWMSPDENRPHEGQKCVVKIETYRFSGTTIDEYPALYKDGVWLCDSPIYTTDYPSSKIVGWKGDEK